MWHSKIINITFLIILTLTSCYSPKVAIIGMDNNYKECRKTSFCCIAMSHFTPFRNYRAKSYVYYKDTLISIQKEQVRYSCAASTILKQKIKNVKTGEKYIIKYLYDKHHMAFDNNTPVIYTKIIRGVRTKIKCDLKDIDSKIFF